jgi:lysozyme family protein
VANWKTCYDFMMQNEDSRREHAIEPDAGGQAISGINSAAFPLQFAKIAALPQAERGPEVEAFYSAAFWNRWFDQTASDEVAKRVFDADVNMGSVPAVRCLQMALGACGVVVTPDGHLGPVSVTAVNAAPQDQLVAAFQKARQDHYRAIVAAHPEKAVYLDAWLARAGK